MQRFITTQLAVRGHIAVLFESDGKGNVDAIETSSGSYSSRAAAETYGQSWAKEQGVDFVSRRDCGATP